MEAIILIVVCFLGGWWLFSNFLGGAEQATAAVKGSPVRGLSGIVVLAIIVFIGLVLLGLMSGGR